MAKHKPMLQEYGVVDRAIQDSKGRGIEGIYPSYEIIMKVTVVLDGETLFSLEAKEWLLLSPRPGELQVAITSKRPIRAIVNGWKKTKKIGGKA